MLAGSSIEWAARSKVSTLAGGGTASGAGRGSGVSVAPGADDPDAPADSAPVTAPTTAALAATSTMLSEAAMTRRRRCCTSSEDAPRSLAVTVRVYARRSDHPRQVTHR